ncbi:hypothetical protein SCAR479_01381 [Seiridium cardinale]|uniref:Uncharacterized protein n=1 Tax=Seiridium cardinale TaxID=138064 RepID=A0ABR2Y5B2_9PEZI
MSQYYSESQWGAGAGQPTWDHQTPPPARSGASSAIPRDREEPAAFSQQLEEVDRAIDNLVKSGKMFGGNGPRRPAPTRDSFDGPERRARAAVRIDWGSGLANGNADGRGSSGPGSQFGDARVGGPGHGPGLQNFYASQRHQSSRGSNEAEQMMQAKRRMAAQRERELRNYHQEQQYNRTVLAEMSYPGKPDRALSPNSTVSNSNSNTNNNNLSEDERRDLIARQRSALYGEGPFENGGYVDETGAVRPGVPGLSTGPSSHRGPSPLAYDYSRGAPDGPRDGPGSRNASPQSNPSNNRGPFDNAIQQASRTSNSSPGGSPPRQGAPGQPGNTVAPIGTRPSISQAPNPALNKRSTTPLPSPLSQGFSASGNNENGLASSTSGPQSNPSSAAPDGYNGWGSRQGSVWGKQSSGLGVQASVWG